MLATPAAGNNPVAEVVDTNVIISPLGRLGVGAIGGLAAILAKFLSQDYGHVVTFFSSGLPLPKLVAIVGPYFFLVPILVLLGAITGWVSDERNRWKLFLLALSAPALLTTLASGPGSPGTAQVPDTSEGRQGSNVRPIALAQIIPPMFGSGDRNYFVFIGGAANAERLVSTFNAPNSSFYAFARGSGVYLLERLTLRQALDARQALVQSKMIDEATIVEIKDVPR